MKLCLCYAYQNYIHPSFYSHNHFPPCSYLLLNSDDEEEDEEDYDSQEHLRRKEVKI